MDHGKKLIKDAIKDGFIIRVYYEDDYEPAYVGTNLSKAWDDATACDCSSIEFFKKDDQGKITEHGSAFLVHGNSPTETVCDYTIGGYAETWDNRNGIYMAEFQES